MHRYIWIASIGLVTLTSTDARANPEEDWEARASHPDVVFAEGFDTAQAVDDKRLPDGSAEFCTFTSDVAASGGGSIQFEVPSNSPANSSGSWRTNFADDNYSIKFRSGDDLYIQWRQRFSMDFLSTVYQTTTGSAGGWKQVIIGEGDYEGFEYGDAPEVSSCTRLEFVVQNSSQRYFPQIYHSCGDYWPYSQPFASEYNGADFLLQNGIEEQGDNDAQRYVLYSQESSLVTSVRDDFPGAAYHPDEWMTFQIHLAPGPLGSAVDPLIGGERWGFTDSTVEMWVARDGEPAVLTHRFEGVVLQRDDGAEDSDEAYGKIWLTPYHTGKDPGQTHPTGYIWYDELIVSRSRIADPGFPSGDGGGESGGSDDGGMDSTGDEGGTGMGPGDGTGTSGADGWMPSDSGEEGGAPTTGTGSDPGLGDDGEDSGAAGCSCASGGSSWSSSALAMLALLGLRRRRRLGLFATLGLVGTACGSDPGNSAEASGDTSVGSEAGSDSVGEPDDDDDDDDTGSATGTGGDDDDDDDATGDDDDDDDDDTGGPIVPPTCGALADVPGEPGPHIADIEALGDDEWIDLGPPAPDPEFGSARGRSWGGRAFVLAPELRGAFFTGEGVHAYVKPDGYGMDDYWFYDIQAHRWITIHPGNHIASFNQRVADGELYIDENGQLADEIGDPVPLHLLIHAWDFLTYDTQSHRFVFVAGDGMGDYYMPGLESVQEGLDDLWAQRAGIEVPSMSPWSYSVEDCRWERYPISTPTPFNQSNFSAFVYATADDRYVYAGAAGVATFDRASNEWAMVEDTGPRPTGIDHGVAYDSTRNRLYMSSDAGPFHIYDIDSATWTTPAGAPTQFGTNQASVFYDSANDVVTVFHYSSQTQYTYEPDSNQWTNQPLPASLYQQVGNPSFSAFYDPQTNAYYVFAAGDSMENGNMWAYRLASP